MTTMDDYTDDKLQQSPAKLVELAISLLFDAYILKVGQEPTSDHEVYALSCLENAIQGAEEAFELLGGDHG